jgi:hypothetical protein
MPEYLFRRTGGVVGLLSCLIEEAACMACIETGAEQLGTELLDAIAIGPNNHAAPAAAAPPPSG